MRFWPKIYRSNVYGARRLLGELSDNVWKLGSIDSLLKRIRKTVLSCNQTRQQQTHSACIDDNIENVEGLVLSHEDKPKRIDWLLRFRVKLAFPTQMCTGWFTSITMQLKHFKRRHAQLLSEAERVARLTTR